ncbi:MAG: glycine--tRNA ligase subunit beta [Acidobacteria bacterium]|nr:glycine--tRNA ligase subunit beta [Acidobacteriota bacterium]
MADFLLEIGTEEIPAGMVSRLADELRSRVKAGLKDAGATPSAERLIAAPRRIGFLLVGLPERQADREESVVGPNLSIAKDAKGNWTKAAEGFARKQGVDLDQLHEVESPKGPCAGFTRKVKGKSTSQLLAEIVPAAVDALYLPKAMRWGTGEQLFVRPVRWVVALLGGQIVPLEIKGVASGRVSRGHRVHGASSIEIHSPDEYFDKLRSNYVIACSEEREKKIERELTALAEEVKGAWDVHLRDQDDGVVASGLLETLVFTCEYPTVFLGKIPEVFASLPEPIFATCLKEHQKSFAVYPVGNAGEIALKEDDSPAVLPNFLSVMDGPADPKGLIKRGNENVTVSRLSDAKFFYDHDVKVPLERRLEELKGIVYHPKLGTYYDKALRLEALAKKLAPFFNEDPNLAGEAARLCKADLASLLVQEKEFTSLQGIAGGLYAKAQEKDPAVSRAISEHYGEPMPYHDRISRLRFLSIVVALADKLDALIQFFKIGLVPTGSKNPFGLRRAASEVVRLLSAPGYASDFSAFRFSLGSFLREEAPACADSLGSFLLDRARYQWEGEPAGASGGSFTYDEVNAILVQGLDDLLDMHHRLEALHKVRNESPEDFDHLSVAHKRAKNLTKGQPRFEMSEAKFAPASDKEGAGERLLHQALLAAENETAPLLAPGRRDYAAFLRRLAAIRPQVDQFFDDVLVMCDPDGKDPAKTALQQNRLALLQRLVALFEKVADLSEIVPARGSNGVTG